MSIIAFTGTPGSGKSYDAVAKIIANLRMGRIVFTNIRGLDQPLCLEMIKMLTGLDDYSLSRQLHYLPDHQVICFWNHVTPGALIVLDEVQNFFNARNWASKDNTEFNKWSSTHRHHGYDVVLLTQNIQRIDSAVRSLVEWTYVYRKMNFFGSLFTQKYLCYAYGGEEVVGSPLAKSVRTYDSKIFLCYQSYVSKDIKEQGIMKHVNVLKHPVFYAIPVVFSYFVYMLFHSGMIHGDLFGTNKQFDKLKGKTAGTSSLPAVVSVHKPYSEHTPSIWTDRTKSGQMLFSNRGSDDKNDQGKKNDAKPPKKT
jgi:zona occludens toxin